MAIGRNQSPARARRGGVANQSSAAAAPGFAPLQAPKSTTDPPPLPHALPAPSAAPLQSFPIAILDKQVGLDQEAPEFSPKNSGCLSKILDTLTPNPSLVTGPASLILQSYVTFGTEPVPAGSTFVGHHPDSGKAAPLYTHRLQEARHFTPAGVRRVSVMSHVMIFFAAGKPSFAPPPASKMMSIGDLKWDAENGNAESGTAGVGAGYGGSKTAAGDHLRDFSMAQGQWAPSPAQPPASGAQPLQSESSHAQAGTSAFKMHDPHSALHYPASAGGGGGVPGGGVGQRSADLLSSLLPRLPYGGSSQAGPQPSARQGSSSTWPSSSPSWPTPPDARHLPPSISLDTALEQHYLQHNDALRREEEASLRGALEQQNKELMRLAAAADRRTSEVESSNKQLAREMANMKDQLHIAASNANEEALLRINQVATLTLNPEPLLRINQVATLILNPEPLPRINQVATSTLNPKPILRINQVTNDPVLAQLISPHLISSHLISSHLI